jgi:hypothetical protein
VCLVGVHAVEVLPKLRRSNTLRNAFLAAISAAALAACLVSGTAKAGELGVDFTSDSVSNFGQSIWNLGYEFTVVSNTTVIGLANFDNGSLGNLPQDQQVGLWDSSGNLLTSAYVGADQGSTQMGLWGWTGISGVTLVAGQTYIVGGQGAADYTGETPVTVSPYITYVQDMYYYWGTTDNNPLYEPLASEGFSLPSQAGWFGGNVVLSGTAIPEPGTVLLLVPALGALALLRRKRG